MEQVRKFKLENLLLFFLLMLPFGNSPQLFNLGEDTGSIYLSILIFFCFMVWLLQEKKLYLPKVFLNKALLLFMALGIIFNVLSILNGTIDLTEGVLTILLFSLPKLFFIYLIISLAERLDIEQALNLLYKFSFILFISLIISLMVYPLNPIPEFVIYDGGSRFGAFHFELVNFTYTMLVGFFIYSFYKKLSIIKLSIALVCIYFVAKSNAFYPFALSIFSMLIILKLNNLKLLKLFIFSIIIISPLIGFFLDYFSFLNFLSIRSVSDFSLEGSSLFVRLYPWALSMNHLIDNFLVAPVGIGMLGLSPHIQDTQHLFGGTGITKVLAEYGLFSPILIILIYYYFISILRELIKIQDKNSRNCFCIILVLSLIYLCIQSGFFNLTVWTFCIIIQTIALKYSHQNTKNS
jgi:hypothetical protein